MPEFGQNFRGPTGNVLGAAVGQQFGSMPAVARRHVFATSDRSTYCPSRRRDRGKACAWCCRHLSFAKNPGSL
jgi:hypothetical protein